MPLKVWSQWNLTYIHNFAVTQRQLSQHKDLRGAGCEQGREQSLLQGAQGWMTLLPQAWTPGTAFGKR